MLTQIPQYPPLYRHFIPVGFCAVYFQAQLLAALKLESVVHRQLIVAVGCL